MLQAAGHCAGPGGRDAAVATAAVATAEALPREATALVWSPRYCV